MHVPKSKGTVKVRLILTCRGYGRQQNLMIMYVRVIKAFAKFTCTVYVNRKNTVGIEWKIFHSCNPALTLSCHIVDYTGIDFHTELADLTRILKNVYRIIHLQDNSVIQTFGCSKESRNSWWQFNTGVSNFLPLYATLTKST